MEIFVRHKISSTPNILQQLWNSRLIALHYQDILSTNPDDYTEKSARNSITRMQRFCRDGGYVGAVYGDSRAKILVGKLLPGTSFTEQTFTDEDDPSISYHYKVAKLEDARELEIVEHPVLASIQPRQGALCEWHSAKGIIEALVKKTEREISVYSLHSGQLEVLCYEYLVHIGAIDLLLAPIGRTMLDIDIIGLKGSGKKVIAQVTFSECIDKLKRLQKHISSNVNAYFFSSLANQEINGVRCISIEHVFNELRGTGRHNEMLKIMCGN
jgi:hypothetical protein